MCHVWALRPITHTIQRSAVYKEHNSLFSYRVPRDPDSGTAKQIRYCNHVIMTRDVFSLLGLSFNTATAATRKTNLFDFRTALKRVTEVHTYILFEFKTLLLFSKYLIPISIIYERLFVQMQISCLITSPRTVPAFGYYIRKVYS